MIRPNLEYAVLDGADLKWADVGHALLKGARLHGTKLNGVYLDGADLENASLLAATLKSASLRGATLSGADFSGALLGNADLREADLAGALFRGAYLFGADLADADLSGADFSGADLRGAVLSGATLVRETEGAVSNRHGTANPLEYAFFGWADLRGIEFDWKLPPGLSWSLVAPASLPWHGPDQPYDARDQYRYESMLGALLVGRACRTNAPASIARGLAQRVLEDFYDNPLTRKTPPLSFDGEMIRPYHQTVASMIGGEAADDSVRTAQQQDDHACPASTDLPEPLRAHMNILSYRPGDLIMRIVKNTR
jgi:hypothetical protein